MKTVEMAVARLHFRLPSMLPVPLYKYKFNDYKLFESIKFTVFLIIAPAAFGCIVSVMLALCA